MQGKIDISTNEDILILANHSPEVPQESLGALRGTVCMLCEVKRTEHKVFSGETVAYTTPVIRGLESLVGHYKRVHPGEDLVYAQVSPDAVYQAKLQKPKSPTKNDYDVPGGSMPLIIEHGLSRLQRFVKEWSEHNFPNSASHRPTIGVSEEIGELVAALVVANGKLSHATLKADQNIRGTTEEHALEAQDAVGDILIYLLHLCVVKEWSMAEIMAGVIKELCERDWINFPLNGKTE